MKPMIVVPSTHQPYNYIWWQGRLRRIPYTLNYHTLKGFYEDHADSLLPLLKTLASAVAKQSALKKQVDSQDTSVYEFIEQLGGDAVEVNQKFAETVFYGVYGTSTRNISAQVALFKKHLNSFGLDTLKKEEMAKCRHKLFSSFR